MFLHFFYNQVLCYEILSSIEKVKKTFFLQFFDTSVLADIGELEALGNQYSIICSIISLEILI